LKEIFNELSGNNKRRAARDAEEAAMAYYQELKAAPDSNLSIVYVQSRNIQIAEFTAQDFLPSTHPVSDHTIFLMHELLLTKK